ncbi:GH25 family lysozyme [Porcipelethomonas sp.]|uniref:GH25 family lysozyme n=1 Tax=Porcipelethomonas sp. TaxID=2981675 RepID=UPI003EFA7EFA
MKRHIKLIVIIGTILVIVYIFIVLWYNGIVWPNTPSKKEYPVRGVDVSSYQGEIDWNVLEDQNIDFAFIKATEGSGYADSYFKSNFENASLTDIRIGAYHFFSFDSSGKTQAENFINTVPKTDNMLPPVIDLEYYGEYGVNPPDSDETRKNLQCMSDMLCDYYGMKPIIYVTDVTYERYIKGYFQENDIWYRSIWKKAMLSDKRKWTFWQYCNRGRLDGYEGAEQYIDLNVFSGSRTEFENYPDKS